VARVLIGTDGSDLARYASRRALDLLGTDNELTVVQVVHPPVLMVPATASGMAAAVTSSGEPIEEPLVRAAEATTADLARDLGGAATQVVVGDPGLVLCRLAAEGEFDVLVVGSHGSGFLKRVLLGSVSHFVLHHAPCPVLVVRSPEGDAEGAEREE